MEAVVGKRRRSLAIANGECEFKVLEATPGGSQYEDQSVSRNVFAAE